MGAGANALPSECECLSTNFFYLPGTIVGAFVADWLGPKRTIILGLVLQSIVGFILSGVYEKLKQHIAGFAIMYGLYLSLGELGPGNNLGLLAAKATGTFRFVGRTVCIGI